MAFYEAEATLGSNAAVTAALVELRAGAAPIYLRELVYRKSAQAGASSTVVLFGPPGNTPAGGTAVLGQATDEDDSVSTGGLISSGWTTEPIAPTAVYRRFRASDSSALGAGAPGEGGLIWDWRTRPLRIKQNASLVFWGDAAALFDFLAVRWEE